MDLKEVNALINKLKKYNINFLINNACQTIRPSQEYINKITKLESLLSENCVYQIRDNNANINMCRDLISLSNNDNSFLKICYYENKEELIHKYANIDINLIISVFGL
jgi:hypothetical protein